MTYDNLVNTHGKNAANLWRQICKMGGFGDVQPVSGACLDLTGLDSKVKKAVEDLLKVKGE